MNVISQITIDLAAAQVPPVVYAKQYDEGTRIVEVQLTNQGVPYEIPDGVTAVFYMAKPDGKFVFYDSGESGPAVSVSGSAVSVTLLAPALQAAGTGKAQVSLYSETGKLSTFNFDVVIQPAAVPDDAISTDYVNVLTQTVQQAVDAAAAAAASAKTAEDAAAAVTGGAVRYDTAQALTDQQKAQARENIGADAAGAVKYSEAQTLTEEQQAQARENIGAEASGAASAVQTNLNSHIDDKENPHEVTAEQAGAVPVQRTVNGKALSDNILLTANDIGAVPLAGTYGTVTAIADSAFVIYDYALFVMGKIAFMSVRGASPGYSVSTAILEMSVSAAPGTRWNAPIGYNTDVSGSIKGALGVAGNKVSIFSESGATAAGHILGAIVFPTE